MIHINGVTLKAEMKIEGQIFIIKSFRAQIVETPVLRSIGNNPIPQPSRGYECYGMVETIDDAIKSFMDTNHDKIEIQDLAQGGKHYVFSNTEFGYVDDNTGEFTFAAKRARE